MDRLLEKLVTDVQVDKRTNKHEFLGPEKLIEYLYKNLLYTKNPQKFTRNLKYQKYSFEEQI